ncbi:MAG: 3'-5' exonuclease [Acidobacteriota bacterium]
MPAGPLADHPLHLVPFVVFDVETTGLVPRADPIVEIAAVKVTLNEEPRVLLDTLVHPQRSMGATEIHGITLQDVQGAPTFSKLVEPLLALFAGRVLVAHNASFDVRFLRAAMEPWVPDFDPPYLCTRELQGLLDGGRRPSLEDACVRLGVELERRGSHSARDDSLAAGHVLQKLLHRARSGGARTLDDLANLDRGTLRRRLCRPPVAAPPSLVTPDAVPLKPRVAKQRRISKGIRLYLDGVLSAVADLRIDPHEIQRIRALQRQLGLEPAEIRALHAKVFAEMLTRYTEDRHLDGREAGNLHTLWRCLDQLGWAPGAAVEPSP